MTAAKNARTAALEALIDAHAIELKLPTVRRRFRRSPRRRSASSRPPSPISLRCWRPRWPNAPSGARNAGSSTPGSPRIKRLEDFRFSDNPKVPQATIAALAEGLLDR